MENSDRFYTVVDFHSIEELGVIVRKIRKKNKQTQQYFADYAGVGRKFLSEFERGKKTLEIGKVFKVTHQARIQIVCSYRH